MSTSHSSGSAGHDPLGHTSSSDTGPQHGNPGSVGFGSSTGPSRSSPLETNEDDGFTSITWDTKPSDIPSSTNDKSTLPIHTGSNLSTPLGDDSNSTRAIGARTPTVNPSDDIDPEFPPTVESPHFDAPVGSGEYTQMNPADLRDDSNPVPPSVKAAQERPGALSEGVRRESEGALPSWNGMWVGVKVEDPRKEGEGVAGVKSKDVYVSYGVKTWTNAPNYTSSDPAGAGSTAQQPTATEPSVVRRRFTDFVFLREHLVKNFPACVVPPIPDKHRLEYIKGDRFSPEFIEHRRFDLQHFMERIARHPKLSRSQLTKDFLISNQWSVAMHRYLATPTADGHTSVLDNVTDTVINAFTKVRKPDERFLELREGLERYEEGMANIERLVSKDKTRTEDLAQDYLDMAAAYQGLGYLESGITEPLNRFAERMLDFSTHLKDFDGQSVDAFLAHIHSLTAYSQAHRSVIKLRDQKQLDFEELSAYLSAVVSERDRLAALNTGHTNAPVGITTYLRDRVDKLRGADDVYTRRERMRKMDGKIKELQDAVTNAHETSTEFNDEVLQEHNIFELSKQEEMKDMLGAYARGQIDMYRKTIEDWESVIPILKRIRVEV